MNRDPKRIMSQQIAVCAGLLATSVQMAFADETKKEPAPVLGKWIRQVDTPEGRVTIIKNHSGKPPVAGATCVCKKPDCRRYFGS